MAKTVEQIPNLYARQYCSIMEAHAKAWRDSVEVITKARQALQIVLISYPLLDNEPNFASHLSAALAAVRRLDEESDRLRNIDARLRLVGFDARRGGITVTSNPHTHIATDSDPGEVVVTLKSRAAIPWYIGWKQGARAGEDLFP